ncbi:hypothetical protein HELRODRAFT_160635 [Helobdella robusta]|uniref:mRNA-decapping enzyme C-terminal domain-containing protein n=1 Tax=Helobdella robusta TaxID=6412 RepID=T1EQJ1_HELRO|nr:hypothetical protein HELRODRAFT_160635 [Helobdella robusta]ESO06463.1 hypothetical protein HELRODRAFT_160635 [Helobdella robusta]
MEDVNLTALRRLDNSAVEILDGPAFVAVYYFSQKLSKWEKKNIEGTLFVYKRSAVPANGFMIINRLYLQDLIEPINTNLEFQLQEPFLLYKDSRNKSICGIWFYDKDECARIGKLMNSLVQVEKKTHVKEQSRQRRASESDIYLYRRD